MRRHRLDPEDWAEIMNEAFAYLIAPVYRYEGTVARLMGDGILAFFGAPIAHEDDPQRALLAGLDIVKGIRPFREQIREAYGLDFNVRVGINTGPVVVGEVGSDLAVEYTAMGDAINLAARMEATAQPGTVQITEHTYKLVAPLFDVWDVGQVAVKGRDTPVQAYRVLGRLAEPGRLRGIEGLASPLVGREGEIALLRRAVADVRSGHGGILCLIGEAGLGKSRLIEELRGESVAPTAPGQPSELVWVESRGVSYDTARPFGLFHHHARQVFGINPADPPQVIREKIAAGTQDLPPGNRPLVARAIEAMLAVETDADAPPVQAKDLRRVLFEAMLDSAGGMATDAPAVFVYDDMHWADPASVELVTHLFQLVEELPLLILCAFRPYRQAPVWDVKRSAETQYADCYTEISLNPLPEDDSDTLVSNLLTISDLPHELRALILRKAEGNPFFVEEVVRSLIDSGAVARDKQGARWRATTNVQEITIPDNLQALLVARVDRLEKEVRRTLQLAAVIGRSFYHRVLDVISDATVALDSHLTQLLHADLIREAARAPDVAYAFRHELTRDAAYRSLLRRQRRDYHLRVGEAIETLFPDPLEEEAHRLAYHFDQARDDERALQYYARAGAAAARIYANAEAVGHYTQAIEIAHRSGADNARLIDLYARLGRTLEVSGRYEEALENYRALERLGRERDDRDLVLAALLPQATIHSTATSELDRERGQALSEHALELAHELNDHRAEAKALWNLMLVTSQGFGDPQRAISFGERSLAIAREHDLQEEMAYALHDLAGAYLTAGRTEDAWAASQAARELWRERDNLPMLADNLAGSGWNALLRGEPEEAFALAEEGLSVSLSIGSLWGQAYSTMMLGILYGQRGQVSQSIRALEQVIPLAEQANFAIYHATRAYLGGIYGFLGQVDRGLGLLQRVADDPESRLLAVLMMATLHLYHRQADPAREALLQARAELETGGDDLGRALYLCLIEAIEAEAAFAGGAYERVLDHCDAALDAQRDAEPRFFIAELHALKGRALLALRRTDDAYTSFNQARASAEAFDAAISEYHLIYHFVSRRTLWNSLLALSQLESQRGNQAAAKELLSEAQKIVSSLADTIDPEALRAAFLALPDVQHVMRAA